MIVDTSALIAIYNQREPQHVRIRRLLEASRDALVLSPLVVAELDYMLASRLGPAQARTAMEDLVHGPYALPPFTVDDLRAAIGVMDRYPDQEIGITDASLVVLAHRFKTHDVLTLDYRHFDMLRQLDGGRFRLLPRDWEG